MHLDTAMPQALLPESFVVKAGLFRFSTGTFLAPDGLTVNKEQFNADATCVALGGLRARSLSLSLSGLSPAAACAPPHGPLPCAWRDGVKRLPTR